MLTHLSIQNYALIRELEISFKDRFNTITGETGTGKSIMLGALGLILGNRADTTALLDSEKKCIVEGTFQADHATIRQIFSENDLDWDEEIILRREISPNGKSRAFVNDTPVTLNILKELGEFIVDIHSQHQITKLRDTAFQLSLLDAFAGHRPLLADYASSYKEYRSLTNKLANLEQQASQAQKDQDYNLFQLNEISAANLVKGEDIQLEEELNILSNAESILNTLREAVFNIYEDESSVNNRLGEIRRQLSSIASLNPKLNELHDRIESLLIECRDVYDEMSSFADTVSMDEERMQEVNERLQLIHSLLSKHHIKEISGLIAYAAELQEKVDGVTNLSDSIESAKKQISELQAKLTKMTAEISANRQKVVPELEKNITDLLRQLGIPEATINIKLQELENFSSSGRDKPEILFSANKGAKPGPLSEIASGGELSRLMLCFKYILADTIFLPTIIFDEIDTGISGEVAIKVGKMMKGLSSKHQVICITHQPQVAALGDHHFVVYKASGDAITSTKIKELASTERIEEIAKMIAGHSPSASAIQSAKELLTQA